MERIRCNCKQCNGTIGIFVNLWTRIGRSYFSPILEPEGGELHVHSHGDVRKGEKHSLVEDCQLQDIACASCDAIVGLECVQTPLNHVFEEKQMLLRSTSITPLSVTGNAHAELLVKRVLQLRERTTKATGRTSTPKQGHVSETPPSMGHRNDASTQEDRVELLHIQADLDVQREDIDRIDSAGYQIVSAFDDAVLRIEREMKSLRDSFNSLKQDMGSNQDDLSSLKTEVNDVKEVVKDTKAIDSLGTRTISLETTVSDLRKDLDAKSTKLRADLAAIESIFGKTRKEVDALSGAVNECTAGTEKYAKEVTALRTEMANLRKQLGQNRSGQSAIGSAATVSSREVDILASNIAKIGNRASQIETLQMEFDILKGRVERMEAERGNTAEQGIDEADEFLQEKRKPARKKRPASAALGSFIDSGGKKKTRLTKSGAVDKRSQRRTSKRLSSDRK